MTDTDLSAEVLELLSTEEGLRELFGPGWHELTGRPVPTPLQVIRGNGPRRQAPKRKRPHRVRRKAAG